MITQKLTCRLALNAAMMLKGAPMKKLIVLSFIMAVMVLWQGFPLPLTPRLPQTT